MNPVLPKPLDIPVTKQIEKKETVLPMNSEVIVSTRTATTTPKKRHRLEVDLSTTPTTNTRATSNLMKGKADPPKAKEKRISVEGISIEIPQSF